jgi:hypothetical protein
LERADERAEGAEMSDIGVAEIPVDEEERPLPPPAPPERNAFVEGPILPTLLQLAWPNAIAFSAGSVSSRLLPWRWCFLS